MHKIIIRLKSGYEIPITCEDFAFEESRLSGELINWEFKGIKDNVPLYCRMADVECIVENRDGIANRPQGEWVSDYSSPVAYRCTACNTLQHWSVIQNGRYRFCPNCGARMKGAKDDAI